MSIFGAQTGSSNPNFVLERVRSIKKLALNLTRVSIIQYDRSNILICLKIKIH